MANKELENKKKLAGGKKMKLALAKIDKNIAYNLKDAIAVLKDVSFAKFDETLDVSVQLGVNVKQSDQMVRGVVSMPFGTGKIVKVAVICKDEKFDEAKNAGADRVGGQDILDDIKAHKVDYDIYITTPDMMGLVSQVARILGPRGLMPNPKLGTVSTDIAKAVREKKAGQVEFKAEKSGIIHAGIGKISFDVENLVNNTRALADALIKAKPSGAKGVYMQKLYLSTTMGPSVRIDLSSLNVI